MGKTDLQRPASTAPARTASVSGPSLAATAPEAAAYAIPEAEFTPRVRAALSALAQEIESLRAQTVSLRKNLEDLAHTARLRAPDAQGVDAIGPLTLGAAVLRTTRAAPTVEPVRVSLPDGRQLLASIDGVLHNRSELQVELARLEYLSTRLVRRWSHLERQRGGIGTRGGPGETQIELDRRMIGDAMRRTKDRLEQVKKQRHTQRKRRDGAAHFGISLVGYTNAGKSSLMRAMTGSEVLVADKLFATLDTTIRPLYPDTRPKVLLSDTVGFIKKLPHDLVASFKSTLDEAANASLLLFVVDASDPSFRSQLEVTRKVLAEVGATESPGLLVLNKRDRLSPEELAALKSEYPDAVLLSTRSKEDLQALRERIMGYFESDMVDEDLRIPFTAQGVMAEIRAKMRILFEAYDADGLTVRVRSTPENLTAIKKKLAR